MNKNMNINVIVNINISVITKICRGCLTLETNTPGARVETAWRLRRDPLTPETRSSRAGDETASRPEQDLSIIINNRYL